MKNMASIDTTQYSLGLEGTWEEMLDYHAELSGRRVRITLLPDETMTESEFGYELSPKLLERYHGLLDKRFRASLTASEEEELERVGESLDEADRSTPLESSIDAVAIGEHNRRMKVLDDVIGLLRSLQINSQ